ncbi:VOC family protein [uncultured Microbacterium sp.]|uniref:VOC family protein n=1 Tax=uncultured Microbacterium sp. TaxID=191216 RepID=UPI0034593A7F
MTVLEDQHLGDYRWVLVGYAEQPGFGINLDLARDDVEKALVGRQAADQPLFSIATDNCHRDYERMRVRGVEFEGEPEVQPWGTSVTFKDIAGNRIHLSQDT